MVAEFEREANVKFDSDLVNLRNALAHGFVGFHNEGTLKLLKIKPRANDAERDFRIIDQNFLDEKLRMLIESTRIIKGKLAEIGIDMSATT